MAAARVIVRYTPAYAMALPLGIETFAKGEKDSEPAKGVCISYAARRHKDSVGIGRCARQKKGKRGSANN